VRLHRKEAILVLLCAAAGCRHAARLGPLPPDWQTLVSEPRPFAALYRFSCCGYRDLVLTVRTDGERLSLTVAVPPGGAALSAWVESDGGWLRRAKESCRDPLPKGVLPVSASSSLPLDPRLAALLLTGLLPSDARELPETPGWVEATTSGFSWRARVEGPEPHCTRVRVARPGKESALLDAELESAPSRVSGVMPMPRAISLVAGSVRAELILQAWQTSEPPAPPSWLSTPVCGARP
jgi:hypothetical protein